jgi:tRNA nucleotidyltransferase (CCA-adding enzyme)
MKNRLDEILWRDDVVTSINDNLDYLLSIIPEIRFMIGFPHNHPHHHLDVWNHTLLALSLSDKDYDIRLALLLHDIGKPFSYQEGKVRHFYNHPLVSANMSMIILERLGYDKDYINYIYYLIKIINVFLIF